MAAVIETDNFDRDYPDESFLVRHISEESARTIADIMNSEKGGSSAQRYWMVKGDDYVLQPGFEP